MLTLPSEAEAMKTVANMTSIRLPKVYRSFNIDGTGGMYDTTGYIVMGYVEGTSLDKCWTELPQSKREDVVGQVADMISQLQSISLLTPGPIGGGPSQGMWFTDYGAGPFTGPSDFEEYFNARLGIAKRTKNAASRIPCFEFATSTFVLTHLNISPRNLILDPKGQVWLID